MSRAPRSVLTHGPLRLRRRRSAAAPDASVLDDLKLRALDAAYALGARSFADLGAVWAVEAGYSFHLADRPGTHVTIVDEDIPASVEHSAAEHVNVDTVKGNFGDPAIAARVGRADAVVMFDVLLHQVAPDWDEVLALYATNATHLILAGPWWSHTAHTVRLLDLGESEYLRLTPPQEINDGLFARLDEIHRRRSRPWRDVHDIWQWGIADADLRAHAQKLGFTLSHHEDRGPWRGLPAFRDRAYVFTRTRA